MSAAIDVAIAAIGKRGTMRTPELAELLGIGEAAIDAMLASARTDGRLTTCTVETGGRTIMEYRCSASGGKYDPLTARALLRPKPPQPARTELQADGVDIDAIHRKPPLEQEEPQVHLVERAQAFFKKHGPMTARQVRELDGGIADRLKQLADQAVLGRLGGKTSGVIYGLPDQKASDAKPRETSPDKPPRSIHKRKGKRKQRIKVAKRRAARNALKSPVKPASRGFRPALAADGAILFLGAERGDFEIDRANARIVVDLVRRLTARELGATVQFVERLDAAEVGA